MKRRLWLFWLVLVHSFALFGLLAVGWVMAFWDLGVPEDLEVQSNAIDRVMQTWRDRPGWNTIGALIFDQGVLVYAQDFGALYWVENDAVFAVNNVAESMSPGVEVKAIDLGALTLMPDSS